MNRFKEESTLNTPQSGKNRFLDSDEPFQDYDLQALLDGTETGPGYQLPFESWQPPIQTNPKPNKVERLLSAFREANNPAPDVNAHLESVAQSEPELFDEFIKQLKTGISPDSALHVARTNYRQKNHIRGGAGGSYDTKMGTPWKRGVQQLGKGLASGIEFLSGTLGSVPAEPPGKQIRKVDDPEFKRLYSQEAITRQYNAAREVGDILAEPVEQWAKFIRTEEASGKLAGPPESGYLNEIMTDPVTAAKRAYMTLGEQTPLMGAMMASTIANPVFGSIFIASVEGGDALATMEDWEKETGKQVDPSVKRTLPVLVGAVNAALEKTGIDNILKVHQVPGLKGKIAQMLMASGIEGSEEVGQEIVQVLAETGYQGEIPQNIGPRLQQSFYAGLLMGSTMSAGSAAVGTLEERAEEKQLRDSINQRHGDTEETMTPGTDQTEPTDMDKELAKFIASVEEQEAADKKEEATDQEIAQPVSEVIERFVKNEKKALRRDLAASAPEDEESIVLRQRKLDRDPTGYVTDKIRAFEEIITDYPDMKNKFQRQLDKLYEIQTALQEPRKENESGDIPGQKSLDKPKIPEEVVKSGYFKADEQWQKSPKEITNAWYSAIEDIEQIKAEVKPQIDQLEQELSEIKGRKRQDLDQRKALREQIVELENRYEKPRAELEQAWGQEAETFSQLASEKARLAGVPRDLIDEFVAEFSTEIGERYASGPNADKNTSDIFYDLVQHYRKEGVSTIHEAGPDVTEKKITPQQVERELVSIRDEMNVGVNMGSKYFKKQLNKAQLMAAEHGYEFEFDVQKRKAILTKDGKSVRQKVVEKMTDKIDKDQATLLEDIPRETREQIQTIIQESGSTLDISGLSRAQIDKAIEDIQTDQGQEATRRAQETIQQLLNAIDRGGVPVVMSNGKGQRAYRDEVPLEYFDEKINRSSATEENTSPLKQQATGRNSLSKRL